MQMAPVPTFYPNTQYAIVKEEQDNSTVKIRKGKNIR